MRIRTRSGRRGGLDAARTDRYRAVSMSSCTDHKIVVTAARMRWLGAAAVVWSAAPSAFDDQQPSGY